MISLMMQISQLMIKQITMVYPFNTKVEIQATTWNWTSYATQTICLEREPLQVSLHPLLQTSRAALDAVGWVQSGNGLATISGRCSLSSWYQASSSASWEGPSSSLCSSLSAASPRSQSSCSSLILPSSLITPRHGLDGSLLLSRLRLVLFLDGFYWSLSALASSLLQPWADIQ